MLVRILSTYHTYELFVENKMANTCPLSFQVQWLIVVITPEAFQALSEWMDYRRKSGEDINKESWLMRTLWDTTTPFNSTIKSPNKMSVEAIGALMERVLKSESLSLDKKVACRHEFKAIYGF